jgi:hypothetical protein
VYVLPGYEGKIYEFYLLTNSNHKSSSIVQEIRPASIEFIDKISIETSKDMYIIMPAISQDQQERLQRLLKKGFTVIVEPEINWYRTRFLLSR